MYGERIRLLRKEKNMTLRELSDALGVPFTTLGNYEREDREPNFQNFKAIADYFQVSIDYLMGRDSIESISDEEVTIKTLKYLDEELSNSDLEIRKKVLFIFENLHTILAVQGFNQDGIREIDLISDIISFILWMKKGLPTSEAMGENYIQPSEPFEYVVAYLKEKPQLEDYFNNLLEFYVNKSPYLRWNQNK